MQCCYCPWEGYQQRCLGTGTENTGTEKTHCQSIAKFTGSPCSLSSFCTSSGSNECALAPAGRAMWPTLPKAALAATRSLVTSQQHGAVLGLCCLQPCLPTHSRTAFCIVRMADMSPLSRTAFLSMAVEINHILVTHSCKILLDPKWHVLCSIRFESILIMK